MSKNILNKINEIIAPKIKAMGYDLWGCEVYLQGRYSILRVYIEHPEKNISLDDCSCVSEQISTLLDVADCIPYSYSLEVSSPGINRPLFHAEHYQRFIGSNVHLRLANPHEGRRNYTGCIKHVLDSLVAIVVDNKVIEMPLDNIEKANLVIEF